MTRSAENLLSGPRSQTAETACRPGICVLSRLLFCWFVAWSNDTATNDLCSVSGLSPSEMNGGKLTALRGTAQGALAVFSHRAKLSVSFFVLFLCF